MGLAVAVGILGPQRLATARIVVEMALGGAGDAVGEIQSRVEPLGGVGGAHLVKEHVGQLVVESLAILGGVEVAVLFAPVAPAAGEAMDHLPGAALGAGDDVALGIADGLAGVVGLGDAGLAEVFADHDVGGELRPLARYLRIVHFEDDRAVGIGDSAGAFFVFDGLKGILALFGESARDLHGSILILGLLAN